MFAVALPDGQFGMAMTRSAAWTGVPADNPDATRSVVKRLRGFFLTMKTPYGPAGDGEWRRLADMRTLLLQAVQRL
jgi:hypothetical protein